jgi:ATP-binding cassette subfamily A (ABC1) protein 3
VIISLIFLLMFDLVRTGRQAMTNPSDSMLRWMGLSPSDSVASASSLLVMLESYSDGMHWHQINEEISDYRYTDFVLMQSISALGFMLLGMYLDQIWPSEYGLRKHPLFPLKCIVNSCWKRRGRPAQDELYNPLLNGSDVTNSNLEPVIEAMAAQKREGRCVSLSHLRKVYSSGKVAVSDLSLDFYSDEIFALLGHNGAGKTTTMSMVSGLLKQSSGSITIMGKDTMDQSPGEMKVLGICPQTNPIYETLTCYEHLRLYCAVKGRDFSETEVDKILEDLDLKEKKHYVASLLSGGQKRKLCVAIAFIGGSRVVLLDEPTSGMDTYARRYLWEMLRTYKRDRVIILSTHYMDEADYLGDRIGIMGAGRLITCGSSLFLKQRFGKGYELTIVKVTVEADSKNITDAVQRYIKTAKKTAEISMEIKYQLPTEESPAFQSLFNYLESEQQNLGIQTFGIELSTLEKVFLNVAHIDEVKPLLESESSEPANNKMTALVEKEDFTLHEIREKNAWKLFWIHYYALCKKRIVYFKRDRRGLICELILPILVIAIGMSLTTIEFIRKSSSGILRPSILPYTEVWAGTSVQGTDIYDRLTNLTSGDSSLSINWISNASTIQSFDKELLNNPVDNRYYALWIDSFDTVNNIFNYTCFVNTTAPFSINICINMAENLFYNTVRNTTDSSIVVEIQPFEVTRQMGSFQNTAAGFICSILVSIAYAFIPASIIVVLVKERENNVKHQQIVSGVSILAYWLSNITVDFLKYLVPATATVCIMEYYDVTVYTKEDNFYVVIILLALFGLDMLVSTYILTLFFRSPSKAQFCVFLINYLGGSILMIFSFVFRVYDKTRDFQVTYTEFFLRVIPIYDLCFGLFSIANSMVWKMTFKLDEVPGPWNWYCALWSVIYLAGMTIIYFCILLALEAKGKLIAKAVGSTNPQERLDYSDEDEDVTKERLQVENGQNYAVRVYNLMIEYVIYRDGFCKKKRPESTKLAVKGVSFGVQKGECFGLLGTNGAGKTSTFKVLSGEILPNYGQAQISGFNVETDMKTIGSLIGYCPQFDALLENLTAKEHLELYAAIKGIPQHMRAKLIESKLQQLNLKQYENVLAGTYSGGNKRKLSVAIALLGNPPIILLDEPSSGMDPEARRFMWSIVSQISTQNKTSSVILTTHSMEEAEALSSKLAIMVEGKIKCIGPVQQLKSKYGQGFEIEVKIRLPTPEEIAELKKLSGTLEERITTQEAAVNLLERTGVVNAAAEFAPNGRCFHFAQQVVLLNNLRYHEDQKSSCTVYLNMRTRMSRQRLSSLS